jgi:hypothetical protein
MANFLTYENEQDALDRADLEGQARGLPYWVDSSNITRVITEPFYTTANKWVLEVTDYTTITEAETDLIIDENSITID